MAEKIRAIVEMNQRHAAIAKLGLDKITEALNAIEGADIPFSVIPKLLATAVAVERAAHGLEATSNKQTDAHIDSREACTPECSARPTIVSERIMALSAVDRDLLRSLTLKIMDMLILGANQAGGLPDEAVPPRLRAK